MSSNLSPTGMMTVDQAKGWQFQHGEEIRDLAGKGDKLAQRVIASYFVYHDRCRSSDRKRAAEATDYWIKTLNEYIVRDLTIPARAELRSKFDHHADDDVIKIKGEIIRPRDIN